VLVVSGVGTDAEILQVMTQNEEHKMPTKPKKPRKEPAERVLIIDQWDEWA
jgi:hypothetical protein